MVTAMMTAPASFAIELRRIKKSFGRATPLVDLDLLVEAGQVVGLLGPNGTGKTTTLRILLGLVHADSGDVRVLGLDPRRDATAVRAKVGALLEQDGLYDRLSAEQNLDYHAQIRRVPDRKRRVEERLHACGLWERRRDRVAGFSKGMRQKLAIARALLHDPALVLLDEPFTGLDPAAAVELHETIGALARSRVTVLLTTHDLAHVERACDVIAIVDAGRVVAQGAPRSLAEGGDELVVRVSGDGLSEEVLAALRDAGELTGFTLGEPQTPGQSVGALVRCTRAQRKGLGPALAVRGVALEELTTERASLEQTFLSLVGPRGNGSKGEGA